MPFQIEQISDAFGQSDDLFVQPDRLGGIPVTLIGLASLIDLAQTQTSLQRDQELHALLSEPDAQTELPELNDAVAALLDGMLLIVANHGKTALLATPRLRSLDRSVDNPSNEHLLQGPLTSFREDLQDNIGILRKQQTSASLRVKSFTVGKQQMRALSMLYLEGRADSKMVSAILARIESQLTHELHQTQDVAKLLGVSTWGIISKIHKTELPQEAASCLRNGRVVLFMDRMPFALILPVQLWDLFAMENDRNYPLTIMLAIRTTRVLGVLLTVVIPGLYVALVSVNPEVLRIELALSIAQSRLGVPYPAIIEMILMLILLELILEASVRLPRTVGTTITMVGGIILGQAIVQAKLVSNLLIIVLAATTISNSTVVGFTNSLSLRFFKYLIVLLAAIYGILGILGGMVIISAYLGGITTFGAPYLKLPRRKAG